jgi:ABC-type antimicrobial peptide transport system permease subunit
MVRVDGDPAAMVGTIRRELLPLTPASGFVTIRPVAASVEAVLRPWRLGAMMFGVFGAVGLLIAAVGLYSVLAYVVDQRRRELGVRVALGAPARRVMGLVVGQGIAVVASGIGIGLLVAIVAAPRLGSLLVGVAPRDPFVLALVAATLVTVAIVASMVPAWRAARVDPVQVLRSE